MGRNLSLPPAFGFQTKEINADAYYQKKLGDKFTQKEVENQRLYSNIAKLSDYVPGLGVLSGSARIISVIKNKDDNNKGAQVTRALMAIFGANILLLLADIAKTGWRAYKATSKT